MRTSGSSHAVAAACLVLVAIRVPYVRGFRHRRIDRPDVLRSSSANPTMAKTPKRSNLRPPGRCIFCGGGGLSKEHMWADWLHAYIPRIAPEHRTRSTLIHLENQEISTQRRAGDPHSRRIRCVCGPCNNGWMSALQEKTKPFMVPMLKVKEFPFIDAPKRQ